MVHASPLKLSLVTLFAFAAAACQTTNPVLVETTFAPTAAFSTHSPGDVAVLPVEDGTPDGTVRRHLVFLRQEIMRQLPDRRFSPITATTVDAGLRAAAAPSGESILSPAVLKGLVGHAAEDAVFALRVDKWDETMLAVDKRVRFQFQAVFVASDGQPLWSGTIQGEVKAGGVGAAPRDLDGMARNCGELAIREMLQRLPHRLL
ncbi:MAG: hypothetical protein JNL08_09885 [Planctomycetes bacterium]|nr:hypothetical protein [Planctomycetota bacterium]